MKHIPLGAKQTLTTYRKIAIASWKNPRDPSTYSWLDLPIEEADAFLKAYPGTPKPSLTHFIAKIVANCLEEHPELNHLLRAGKLHRRARTDVFITTLLKTPLGKDLSGFVIRNATGQSLGDVARESAEATERLRRGEDPDTARIDHITARMPIWAIRLTMRFEDFVHYRLNLSMQRFGLPDDRLGSVVISNFGVLGIDNALIPLSPYSRCPLIIGVGRPRPMPIARNSQIVVSECVTISFTFDHRYADGVHGGLLLRRFQKIFLKPNRYPAVFEAAGPGATVPAAEPEQEPGTPPMKQNA